MLRVLFEFQAPAYHLIFEALLLIWIVKLLFFTKTFNLAKSDLTEKVSCPRQTRKMF